MFKWTNLAPRVGLIYDLFSDGKTLFKASYSRFPTRWAGSTCPTPTAGSAITSI
jgi:hypothetical protein